MYKGFKETAHFPAAADLWRFSCTPISSFSLWLPFCSLFWLPSSQWRPPAVVGFKLSCGNESALKGKQCTQRRDECLGWKCRCGTREGKGSRVVQGGFWARLDNKGEQTFFYSPAWVNFYFIYFLVILAFKLLSCGWVCFVQSCC